MTSRYETRSSAPGPRCTYCGSPRLAHSRDGKRLNCLECHRVQPRLASATRSAGRPRVGRAGAQALHGAYPGGDAPRASKLTRKRELMEQARRAGWRGKTFHGAKKFERKLERASQ